jgi:hypothetical protein
MMPRFCIFAVLILGLCLISCSDDDNPVDSNQPGDLFTVVVIDTSGKPDEGIRVGSINHWQHVPMLKSLAHPNPSTTIGFSLPERTHVALWIENYYHDTIIVLVDDTMEAGAHQIAWEGTDSLGNTVISGFYYYVLMTQEFLDQKAIVFEYGPDPSQTIIGTTNSEGVFASSDTLLFPGLLGDPPQIQIRDELGNPLDSLFQYSDSLTITLSDPAEPDKFIYFDKKLTVGENRFELTWDPNLAQ